MTRIFWDTHLFIYLFEGGARADDVVRVRQRMLARGDRLFTSALTLGEIQVKPIGSGDAARTRDYEQAIAQAATVVPFDASAARHYASIRQDRSLRPGDAMQLACAAAADIDLFIAHDDRLADRHVPGVKFICSLERAFL